MTWLYESQCHHCVTGSATLGDERDLLGFPRVRRVDTDATPDA